MSLLDTASLIVTPNGYKEGKLYSVIPSDGSGDMSVTRATTATRVNSAGLVELVPYNLLTYSNTFSNAAWTKTNTTVTSGQSGYDGSTNAWKLQATATNNCEVDQGFSESQTKNFSIYAKAGNVNFVAISVFGAGFGWYNLSNGTLGSSGGTFVSRNIESVGNGWYRCSIVTNVAASGVAVYVCNADNSIATSVGSNIFIQNSQLESGNVPTTYQKTETRLNIPRLDYSNGTCPSLLVEPQRTNVCLYSSQLDNGAWVKDNNGSGTLPVVTANYATAPDGTTSADRAQFSNVGGSGSGSNYSMLIQFGLTLSSTGTATIYLKSNTSSNQEVLLYWAGGEGDVFTVTPEWQRFTLNNLTATTTGLVLGTRGGSGSFFNGGDEVLDILVWGAQVEVGTYATSYIPTTSASVTRNADVISKTGISSLIGQTEGTMFVDVYRPTSNSPFIFMLANSTGANAYLNSLYLYQVDTSQLTFDVFVSGALQASIATSSSGLSVGRHKIAFAYKQNDFVLYVDGTQIGTDTSGNVPTLSAFEINGADIASISNVETNAVALWQTRLTNTQLAQLTTI
jgi:hypothetical protein